jgi:ornithine decarboxylase
VVALEVDPCRIIYANPTKQVSHLRYAESVGVTRCTFDNTDELLKISKVFPDAELVLRILVDDSYSICKLGTKYGAHPSETRGLFDFAKELGLNVIGVSFHVGSGCQSACAFSDAVQVAKVVFDEGNDSGFNLTLLDVGGGFPGTDHAAQAPVQFAEIASVLSAALDHHFPAESGVRIIAEPGRFVSVRYIYPGMLPPLSLLGVCVCVCVFACAVWFVWW